MVQENFIRENPIFFLMESSGHRPADLSPAFPGLSVDEIVLMLKDNRFGLRRTVERFGYLGIRECRSKYFNIHKSGYRLNGANSVESNDGHQIHCYGGSSTLGANVADNQTISAFLESQLQKKVKVNVFNFGAGNHTSLHSSLRLLDHVLSGHIPELAIFLNGFNDVSYSAGGADGILQFLDQVLEKSQDSDAQASKLQDFIKLIPQGNSKIQNYSLEGHETNEDLCNNVATQYAASVSIQNFIAKSFGVKILRFIEPSIFLSCHNHQRLLPRISSGNIRLKLVERLYNVIGDHGCKKVFGNHDYISLVDTGQGLLHFPLYVDEAHFTPQFNAHIAEKISAEIFFPRRDVAHKRRQIKSRETMGVIEEVVNPYNYPLF